MGFEFRLQLDSGKVLYGHANNVDDFYKQIDKAEKIYNSKVVHKMPDVESESFKWVNKVIL